MRSYRMFLGQMGDNLLEVLRVMENEEWHHDEEPSDTAQAYAMVVMLLEEIVERAKHYVNTKGLTGEERTQANKLAAAREGLDRLLGQHHDTPKLTEHRQLNFDDYHGDQARLDGTADPDGPVVQ